MQEADVLPMLLDEHDLGSFSMLTFLSPDQLRTAFTRTRLSPSQLHFQRQGNELHEPRINQFGTWFIWICRKTCKFSKHKENFCKEIVILVEKTLMGLLARKESLRVDKNCKSQRGLSISNNTIMHKHQLCCIAWSDREEWTLNVPQKPKGSPPLDSTKCTPKWNYCYFFSSVLNVKPFQWILNFPNFLTSHYYLLKGYTENYNWNVSLMLHHHKKMPVTTK